MVTKEVIGLELNSFEHEGLEIFCLDVLTSVFKKFSGLNKFSFVKALELGALNKIELGV